jgi:hypothetical protein
MGLSKARRTLVCYYGWYSNKMRGRRAKQADEEAQAEGDAVEVIDVSAHDPRRMPSKKWRELIKKVWEADPMQCSKCSREMHRFAHRRRDPDWTSRMARGKVAEPWSGIPPSTAALCRRCDQPASKETRLMANSAILLSVNHETFRSID